ncbi:dihydroneopterin aldolase [Sphingomonas sp. RB56-2]|uniref:dihydroneopterin aldolase n=1 Tax=Sphingomonas brevis TaxID=2908206 RepID=A0ABT0S7X6_9SPHN|nr:dihydroneopterin aldolase [Sphingomonas brevis]MCL6740516.1 dihydroneopterin aldolase [Sphingomonas brevis]
MTDEAVKLQGMIPSHLKIRQSRILLDSLEVMTDIGFHEFEVGVPQRLLITVELWLEDVEPPADDDHQSAWNYDYLRTEVIRIAKERRYNLQETLVHAIFDRVAAYRGVRALRIKSVKPDIYEDAQGVGVEIASFPQEASNP